MEDFDKVQSVSPKERTIYLNVTFANAMGQLRNRIPASQDKGVANGCRNY